MRPGRIVLSQPGHKHGYLNSIHILRWDGPFNCVMCSSGLLLLACWYILVLRVPQLAVELPSLIEILTNKIKTVFVCIDAKLNLVYYVVMPSDFYNIISKLHDQSKMKN